MENLEYRSPIFQFLTYQPHLKCWRNFEPLVQGCIRSEGKHGLFFQKKHRSALRRIRTEIFRTVIKVDRGIKSSVHEGTKFLRLKPYAYSYISCANTPEADCAARVPFCNWFSEAVRNYIIKPLVTLDFKLSPCSKCCILSFGRFPGVWILCADVSEHYVPSSPVLFRNVGPLPPANNPIAVNK